MQKPDGIIKQIAKCGGAKSSRLLTMRGQGAIMTLPQLYNLLLFCTYYWVTSAFLGMRKVVAY